MSFSHLFEVYGHMNDASDIFICHDASLFYSAVADGRRHFYCIIPQVASNK